MRFRLGDVTDPDVLHGFAEPFDHVYLLAGVLGARLVQARPAHVVRTNALVIVHVLDWLAEVGCGRLLFASTSEVYAGSVETGVAKIPTAEDVPLAIRDIQHPRATYAATKLLGEAAVTHAASAGGFQAVIVRFHNVYGPRMGMAHVIPELMGRAHRRLDPLPVYGPEQTRAFCYVSDAVEAAVALMRCTLSTCEIVHAGNADEETRIEDLARRICALAGYHPRIAALPALSGAVARRCPDLGKLRRLTGYEPRVSLDDGLARTWAWYRPRLAEESLMSSSAPHEVIR